MSRWGDQYKLSGEKAKSADGKLPGNIRELENNYVLIQSKSKFYIPTYLIEKYEGGNLWFRIDGDEAKSKFKIATEPFRS